MKVIVTQTLNNMQIDRLTHPEPLVFLKGEVAKGMSMSIAKFIEPYLDIDVKFEIGDTEFKTEIFVLSKAQAIAICENVGSLIGICQTEEAMNVVRQHLQRVQELLNANNFDVKQEKESG